MNAEKADWRTKYVLHHLKIQITPVESLEMISNPVSNPVNDLKS